MTKSDLRKMFLERRAGLSAADVAVMSKTLADKFFALVEIEPIKVLHCYLPINRFNEPDTRLILERVWSEYPSVTTAVPRIDFATQDLQSVVYSPTCPVIQNKWGLTEPEGGTVVSSLGIDIVIAPLLCFDMRGYRVGYGKGYYDRFLTKCRADCQKIGLTFFPPVDRIDDVHDGDVPLDLCLTPDIIWSRNAETQNMQVQ